MANKSENCTAFRNELTSNFAEYAGLRRAFVLPYHAPANGRAEPSVARIARLLVCHKQQFRNWPNTLPMKAFAFNCTKHLSTGVSPFFAPYGRHPISLPELENPSLVELQKPTETGNEFVDTLATRLRQAWLAVRDTSESIRLDAAACSHAHHRRWLKPNTMDSNTTPYAWILVVATGIQPAVKVTACKRAPDDWWTFDDLSSAFGRFDKPATTLAAARGNPYEVGGQINQPDLTQGKPNVFLVNQILD
eukprot:4073940-Pleurochrysis_carterae.AAC.1